jgi:hypothetical protein
MNDEQPIPRYAARFADDSAIAVDDEIEHLGAFGFYRGSRERAEMLELRKRTGNIRAVAYSWIAKVDFDPSSGLTIHVGDEAIKIKGRNLNVVAASQISLLGGLIRHRVPWIAEADQRTSLQADKKAVVVESIDW